MNNNIHDDGDGDDIVVDDGGKRKRTRKSHLWLTVCTTLQCFAITVHCPILHRYIIFSSIIIIKLNDSSRGKLPGLHYRVL